MLRRSTRWIVRESFKAMAQAGLGAHGWPSPGAASRRVLAGLLFFALGLAAAPAFGLERETINFDYVAARARELAETPYDDSWGKIPDYLEKLTYDQYQEIRFDPLRALWTADNLPFRIQFHHPGGFFRRAVRIHEFTESHVQEIRFDTDFFSYGKQEWLRPRIPASLGYGGFTVHYPINKAGVYDVFASFQGSNYFRVVGRDQAFGLSARALALNTTVGPEEFPAFREYWLGKPDPKADSLVIFALLDSPSVTGAYQFKLRPGKDSTVAINTTLYFRKDVKQVGLAPFSSMFYYGENSLIRPQDYRPEVHDSDGLLIAMPDGRRLWQPLNNPATGTQVSQWRCEQPTPFGLMQRDRSFNNYQDIGAAYQIRPNGWVEPGPWGAGQVTLFAFSTRSEAVDNVVSFWEPEQHPVVGQPYSYQYKLHFSADEPTTGGLVIATRAGRDLNRPELFECVVDFDSAELRNLKEVDSVKPVVENNMGGKLETVTLDKNPFNGSWRLILKFHPPDPQGPRELRAHLEHNKKPITETWNYRWTDLPS
jgi:glucans biosynthesis protein